MNLQSNALRFTKQDGNIRIICQYVRGVFENEPRSKRMRIQSGISSLSSSEKTVESNNSEHNRFQKDHEIKGILKPLKERNKIVISVIDSGIGIRKKEKLKLFKLFGTLQSTREMNTTGIGLGLVISEKIVKSFGGIIGVRSKYGRGT